MIILNGILNIEKPYGITSMETIRRLKRVSNQKRIGHTGTLDPIATGVIPICFGKATRLADQIMRHNKEYIVKIHLGITTDTYDSLGKIIEEKDISSISLKNLDALLPQFRGEILQIPPMYSALKHNGKRLYQIARAGLEVPRAPRKVSVQSIELIDFSLPFVELKIECSKGFYVRSLANDIGRLLGCGAIMSALVRTKSGPFHLEDAIPLAEAEEKFRNSDYQKILMPVDVAVSHLPIINVNSKQARDLSNGKLISIKDTDAARLSDSSFDEFRVYDPFGTFVGIVSNGHGSDNWHPEKIFNLASNVGNC